MHRQSIQEFLDTNPNDPVLDVRSPSEHNAGHLPGAISFPLFSDQERAAIGTLYKQQGKKAAVLKGLEFVGPKMPTFIQEAEKLKATSLRLYCWRGGMRSESMAWLLDKYGFETQVLAGGYKAYRNALLDFFEQPLPLLVITGYTGSKKTELLHHLKHQGSQVVDLEALANHQGSSFGNQTATGDQPTSEHFQNLLFQAFRGLDLNLPIFIEDESIRIGKVNLPDGLFRQMAASAHVLIEAQKSQRIDYLVSSYGKLSPERLIQATMAIRKKLGDERAKNAVRLIGEGRLSEAADIILTYYDRRYESSLRAAFIREKLTIDLSHVDEVARHLASISGSLLHEPIKK